jgi:hypothetical protein
MNTFVDVTTPDPISRKISHLLRLKDLLDTLEQDIRVLLLEDKHRPQSDGLSTATTNVDT